MKTLTNKELLAISNHCKYEAWKLLENKGLIKHRGLVLHHKDVNLKKNNYLRYIEWRLEDLEIMDKREHLRLHHTGRKCTTYTKQLMRDKKLGVPKSAIHRQHMSESHKRYWQRKKIEQLNQDMNK